MEALLLRPLSFDPTKRYPVYQHTYAGPHAPQVLNKWGSSTYMFHQFLAQNGIAVWICDNRTATGKGVVSAWPVHKNFGELELRDILDGVAWLKLQPWVDGSRLLLNGWSYGGFMTTYALTHSDAYKAGIAGGSVTDWRNYDSIYTERIMLTPGHNAAGYERSAPLNAAKNLRGNLLLIHGTMDDNVHAQNTIQFAHELQKAGKPFELMLYPTQRHTFDDDVLIKHRAMTMWRFVKRELLGE
jgi:dipeptidyl-peptidase 4